MTKDTITKAGTQVSSTVTTLQGIDAQGELKSAFKRLVELSEADKRRIMIPGGER